MTPRRRSLLTLTAASLVASPLLLSACASTHGPRRMTLTAADIERAIVADLGSLVELARGLDVQRPQVALMPVAGRVQLAWAVAAPAEAAAGLPRGAPLGVEVITTGRPRLNASGTAIDLVEMRLDDVRISGLPRLLGFSLGRLAGLGNQQGAALPDLPLVTLSAAQLQREDVAYAATAVEVTAGGLVVSLAPR